MGTNNVQLDRELVVTNIEFVGHVGGDYFVLVLVIRARTRNRLRIIDYNYEHGQESA